MGDKLYIIGNGFDLHHNLRTSYANFREKKKKKKHLSLWEKLLDIYGDAPKQDFWWKDFENMLGNIDYAHLTALRNGEALGASRAKNFLKWNLRTFFGDWIKVVESNQDYRKIKLMDEIEKEALFFTFNYTLLLEKAYHVEERQVWHIHESIKNADKIVVGHDSDYASLFSSYRSYIKNNPNVQIRPDIIDGINQQVSDAAKKVKDRIYLNGERFNEYSDIKHFVVMGFSFNDIDLPYIKKICDVNKSLADADWTLYWHGEGEEEMMKNKLIGLGVSDNNITTLRW